MIKRVKITKQENVNFIGCWKSDCNELMDELVKNFEINNDKHDIGVAGYGNVDKEKKNSTDLTILPKEINDKDNKCFVDYFKLLNDEKKNEMETVIKVIQAMMPVIIVIQAIIVNGLTSVGMKLMKLMIKFIKHFLLDNQGCQAGNGMIQMIKGMKQLIK